jgi:two-component system invasion response regulator UvrY
MKIIIVEDNREFAKALKIYLEGILNYEVSEIYEDGIEFLEGMKNQTADLIMLDIHMPKLDGYSTGKLFNFNDWQTPMIMITMSKESLNLEMLIKNGFKGAILKKNVFSELPKAIDKVMKGEFYFPDLK